MAIIGYGATLFYSSDGSSYTQLAEVVELMPPEVEVGDVNVTHLLSANAAKEYIPGLIDGGESDFKCLFDKTRHNTLYGFLRTTYYWRITVDDGTTDSKVEFRGHIKKIGLPTPLEDKVETTVKIKVTGKPTFTAGS